MSAADSNFGQTINQRVNPSITRYEQFRDQIMQALRVAVPGQVYSFNPGPPATVTVQVATSEYVMWNNPSNTVFNPQTQAFALPLLQDVPLVPVSGGGWSVTLPIKSIVANGVGDEVLVVFSDTEIDVWFQNGGTANNPISQRRHSLSDAFAILGPRSTPNSIENWSTTAMEIRSDDHSTYVALQPNQITVNAGTVNVQAGNSGTVNVTGENINIDNSQTITINAAQELYVDGGNITITGTSTCNISAAGNTEIESRIFLEHQHSGVTAGSSISGPVV